MLRHRNRMMPRSILLYFAARQFGRTCPPAREELVAPYRFLHLAIVLILGGGSYRSTRRASGCRLEPADQMRPSIPGAFAVGIGLSFIGFVNIRGTAARLRTIPAGTGTRFIGQMAYSDWRVILAEFGACQTRSSPLERCGSRVLQASSCSAATIAALIP